MVGEEGLHLAPAVDGAAIPEQVDRAAKMPEQVPKERADVETREIAGAASKIEREPLAPGRDREPAADGEPIVAVAVAQTGGLALGCPGPTDVGDEQKAALIDEHEMGATSSGVFLSGANPRASTGRCAPRRARRRGARASGNSTPAPSAPSRRERGDTESQTPLRSARRFDPASTDPWCSRPGAAPASAGRPAGASGCPTTRAVVPASAWLAALDVRGVDTPATTETPNSPTPRPGGRRRRGSSRTSATAQHGDGASPVARRSPKVSCSTACETVPTIIPLFLQYSIREAPQPRIIAVSASRAPGTRQRAWNPTAFATPVLPDNRLPGSHPVRCTAPFPGGSTCSTEAPIRLSGQPLEVRVAQGCAPHLSTSLASASLFSRSASAGSSKRCWTSRAAAARTAAT